MKWPFRKKQREPEMVSADTLKIEDSSGLEELRTRYHYLGEAEHCQWGFSPHIKFKLDAPLPANRFVLLYQRIENPRYFDVYLEREEVKL